MKTRILLLASLCTVLYQLAYSKQKPQRRPVPVCEQSGNMNFHLARLDLLCNHILNNAALSKDLKLQAIQSTTNNIQRTSPSQYQAEIVRRAKWYANRLRMIGPVTMSGALFYNSRP